MVSWNKVVPSAAEQRELKRDALLRQAALAFRTNGYHGTSLSDIADLLGISKPTLYYYVKNKQDLLFKCHLAASEQALDSVCRDTSLDALERVCQTLSNYVRSMIADDSYSVVILEERSLNPEQLAEVIAQRDEFEQTIVNIIREGVEEGSIVACEPKFAAFCALGTANWVTKWYRREGSWEVDEISVAVSDFLRNGLSPSPARAGSTRLFAFGPMMAGDLKG
ncbi:TetR/AcrR family transcriptional regulator [Oricola indica]|jgi:TetR/AcrR family transcriptional regulator|uniref:TetR/AcrR family transcriptional regulator n=1 Tax=Oricola indica TaxID=2872591 RepID=UPI001CBB1E47|nr:TetR/AcrR family transcriptional regulator [Oricola indica]